MRLAGGDARLDGEKRHVRGRFAPSPTGRMHAGNIYAALASWLIVKSCDGEIILRIEDLDAERSKQRFVDDVQRDFEMLGLTWDEGPYFQHNRGEAYHEAFKVLEERELTYPCFCTRADLHAASAPHQGEKLVYPGTCRYLTPEQRVRKREELAHATPPRKPSVRLAVDDRIIALDDAVQGHYSQQLDCDCGDFLIRRSDGAFAYQLAVVVDDAAQGVTSVTRGVDLLCSTPQQIYLQQLLGYETPEYAHIPLLVAEDGRRLAKRNRDATLDELIVRFKSPQAIIGHIAGITGLAPTCDPATPERLLQTFDLAAFRHSIDDPVRIPWR